ncbi:MAG: family 2 glycosyl transferase [Cytophagaceae bacterium SCN 52-12]|nr:MAG: family 2 glycosyl transferase [Cytophagaceae bacterium SCN 52-12]
MVSVAMCTYNGAKYLAEQLESIARQSRQVDELVVCDDKSTDGTVGVLQEFAAKAPFPVKIHINEANLGSTRNFDQCMGLCRGEILILCDQDDIWAYDRVQRQVDYLAAHPEHEAVFSDAYLIDDKGERQNHMLWDNFGFNRERQVKWQSGKAKDLLFEGYIVTGATMAVRKRALGFLSPFPVHLGPYIHDAWIALVLSLNDQIGFITDPLLSYRVHASQQVGFGQKLEPVRLKDRWKRDRDKKISPIRQRAQLLKALIEALEKVEGVSPASLTRLKELQVHFQVRANLPENRLRRLEPALSELVKGRYTFSSEHWWLPFLGDLLE